MMQLPVARTRPLAHHEYEMSRAATRALIVVLIALPIVGLAYGQMIAPEERFVADRVTVYSLSQMLAYSPMVSWLGLLIGVPCVHWTIRNGYGGWLVTAAIGALCGTLVLSGCVLFMLDVFTPRIAGIGAAFGAGFALVYWGIMRLSNPALFRSASAKTTMRRKSGHSSLS